MRLYALILLFGALSTICANPEPKKYKSDVKEKNKHSNTTLTSDEKKFLRDVEAKFGVENESPKEEKKVGIKIQGNGPPLGHFPAVIAIEIVNDTDIDTKTKGKRTIDANLGYGYKTNNGYTYSYFGKPSQEKGKFMIYPYSQEDIPAGKVQSFHTVHHYEKPNGKHIKTSVEIQPSQAFELVAVKDQKPGYQYNKPSEHSSASTSTTSHGYGSTSFTSHPSTLYTTYDGQEFSGLSGQFPSVMSNYLVDPSQLIKDPEYQSVGLTQDHLQSSHIEQKVVPVLVLRIPSSSLKNPTAELYADLPQNYPLSNYLNNLNLQQLVNQYFQKIGFNTGPQVMTYSSPLSSISEESSSSHSNSHHDHYSHPHVRPSYSHSHSHSSGVQYSAIKPVMAKYPPGYTRHHYSPSEGENHYKHSSQPYYEYQYIPQSPVSSQNFFVPSTHFQHQTEHAASQGGHQTSAEVHSVHEQGTHVHEQGAHVHEQGARVHEHGTHVQYEVPSHLTTSYQTSITHDTSYAAPQENSGSEQASPQVAVEYETVSQAHGVQYDTSNGAVAHEYDIPKDENSQSLPAGYTSSSYESPKDTQEYYTQNTQHVQQDTGYPSQDTQSQVVQTDSNGYQTYIYHQQQESDGQGLVLTENYPSKDHTIATVLPAHYAAAGHAAQQNAEMVQTVSYVTPMPHSKYKIPYQIMVPQTYLKNPTTEKVTYVHSHAMSEPEYTAGYHYMPSAGSHPKPSHPSHHYHTHPKRMVHKHVKPRRAVPKNKRIRPDKKRPS